MPSRRKPALERAAIARDHRPLTEKEMDQIDNQLIDQRLQNETPVPFQQYLNERGYQKRGKSVVRS